MRCSLKDTDEHVSESQRSRPYWSVLTDVATEVQTNKYLKIQQLIDFMQRAKRVATKVFSILRQQPGQSIREIASRLHLNRSYVAGYLDALENLGCIESKRIGPAKAYFMKTRGRKS